VSYKNLVLFKFYIV